MSIKTIFDTCTPRAEVLTGELKEQQFAASLTKVLRGTADPIYGDATTFFANTYATKGLKSLLHEALGRLSGKRRNSASVIRLETNFGGGKSHNLIGLYHVCDSEIDPNVVEGFVGVDSLPSRPIAKIAGIVGPDIGVADGVNHEDLCIQTLWGELAYQIGFRTGGHEGGKAAYELVRKSDEGRTAPSTQPWEKLIGDDPALIMIDEIGQYLRVSSGVQVAKTTLAEQTVAFLMSLMKFASESKATVLVYTLADSGDAFGKESDQVREALAESKSVSAREEHVLTPTAEDEISAVVSHRMFAEIDKKAAKEVARCYADYYGRMVGQDVDLPQRATRSDYSDDIVKDYPFHPELLTTLNRKTSTIPNFQRTRGVLRILAQTIRKLWEEKPKDCYLIAPFCMDLADDQTANDLTSRLDRPQYKQVIEADIASPIKGSPAHAQGMDEEFIAAGRPPYGQRIATTVFLHSLVQTGQSGADPADLRLAVLQPDDDPSLLDKAVQRLVDRCWYFDYDGLRYRFKPEPAPRKIIDDEMGMVGKIKAKTELDERIKKVWKKGTFGPEYFPAEAADLDDDAQTPKLAVVHYDAANVKATEAAIPPDLVLKLFEHKGSMEEYRTYKNNVLFLVADEDQVSNMVDVAQRYLAAQRVVNDTDRMKEFTQTVAEKLTQMAEAAELDLRVAITRGYRHLYYPSADAPRKASNLAHQLLQPDEQGQMAKDQSEVVLKVLKGLDKVLTADDKPLNAQYVKAKAWTQNAVTITTEDLRRAFCQRLGLKMLLDINQLKKTIKEGVQKGTWVYYLASEGAGYGPVSPTPVVEISDEATLYTPEEAKRVGIKIKGEEEVEETCPVCKRSPCVCDQDACPTCGQSPCICKVKVKKVSGEGTPAQAFQAIADQCHDGGVKSLSRLFIRIEGMGKDAAKDVRSLGLAVPQIGKVQLQVDQRMVLEFGGEEKFTVEFRGSWDRYKLVKQVTDTLSQQASNASVRMGVRADFEGGLAPDGDQFQTIRDVLVSLGVGKVFVDGQPGTAEGGADG
jgi:hypothetical protein